MLATLEAIVENGQIRLLEEMPLSEGTRLYVTILPDWGIRKTRLTEDEAAREQWRQELMDRMRAAQEEYRASGEPFLDSEGISRYLNRDRFENLR